MTRIAEVDHLLPVLGIIAEVTCASCMIYKRAYKSLFAVAMYLVYTACSDVIGYVILMLCNRQTYWYAYLAISLGGYVCELVVMWELASIVVSSENGALSRRVRYGVALYLFGMGVLSLLATAGIRYRDSLPSTDATSYLQLDMTFATFRVLVFLGILALVYFLGLGWRRVSTEVTACLFLYAVVVLIAQIAHEYGVPAPFRYGFAMIERIRTGFWCGVLLLLSWYVVRDSKSSAAGLAGGDKSDRERGATLLQDSVTPGRRTVFK